MLKKGENLGNVRKRYPFGTYKLTREMDRKQNYFEGWPKLCIRSDMTQL